MDTNKTVVSEDEPVSAWIIFWADKDEIERLRDDLRFIVDWLAPAVHNLDERTIYHDILERAEAGLKR